MPSPTLIYLPRVCGRPRLGDVIVPLVTYGTASQDTAYVPSYPFCPDCGGALVTPRSEHAVRGARISAGDPDSFPEDTPGYVFAELGNGCGSRFVDSRYTEQIKAIEQEAAP